ncbi:MAG: hypothetical protein H6Q22_1476 [Bacteroidetes bacterium]|nr:hypothetical protein [Bacteroidota bacterium]
MLNNNKVAEIRIIISGLIQDLDTLESSRVISPLKWEEIFISLDTIRAKFNTIKAEQDKPLPVDNLLNARDEEIKKLSLAFAELKRAFADVQLNVSKSFIPNIPQSPKKAVNYFQMTRVRRLNCLMISFRFLMPPEVRSIRGKQICPAQRYQISAAQ